MEFIVDRKTWLRGKGSFESQLLTRDGQRCCIGFVCQQLNVPDDKVLKVSIISSIEGINTDTIGRLSEILRPTKFGSVTPSWISEAYVVNDDKNISDSERESQLQALANSAGHSFKFIN